MAPFYGFPEMSLLLRARALQIVPCTAKDTESKKVLYFNSQRVTSIEPSWIE